jgi:8-oxo-dGTP diphosphatase
MTDFAQVKSCSGGEIGDDLPPLPYLKTILVAAVLLIDSDGRILLAQRPESKSMAGLWEFPGGKVEHMETPEYALIRELKEELDIMTGTDCLQPITFASYSYEDFHLLMPLYVCRTWKGHVKGQEGQNLAWVHKHELKNYPMPAADIPLIPLIHQFL